MTDLPSRQRGRPPEEQNYKSIYRTQNLVMSPRRARHHDRLADWPSAVTWLWLWLWPKHQSPASRLAGHARVRLVAASTLHRRNHETTCLDSSLEKPTIGRLHGTRRQLAYRPSSAAGPALARHTPPARLPARISRWPSTGTAHAASSPTDRNSSTSSAKEAFVISSSTRDSSEEEVPSSPLLLLATHRKKFFRHLFSYSPTQKALSSIPPSFTQQALFRAPQSLSGVHDSLWILIPHSKKSLLTQ
jgi:hypothetical protein